MDNYDGIVSEAGSIAEDRMAEKIGKTVNIGPVPLCPSSRFVRPRFVRPSAILRGRDNRT
jgi:hypothetical protein